MPSLQNLEKFRRELNQLGQEPQVLAKRGEKLEDVTLPEGAEEGLPPDLDALLSGIGEQHAAPVEPEAPAGRTRGLMGRASRLSTAPPGRVPPVPETREPEPSPEEPADDFFLDDFLRSEGAAEESELTALDRGAPNVPSEPIVPETVSEPESPPPAQPESESAEGAELPDLSDLFGEPAEQGEAPPTPEAPSFQPPSSPTTSGEREAEPPLESFDLGDIGAIPEFETEPPASEAAEEGPGEPRSFLTETGVPEVELGAEVPIPEAPEPGSDEELFFTVPDLGEPSVSEAAPEPEPFREPTAEASRASEAESFPVSDEEFALPEGFEGAELGELGGLGAEEPTVAGPAAPSPPELAEPGGAEEDWMSGLGELGDFGAASSPETETPIVPELSPEPGGIPETDEFQIPEEFVMAGEEEGPLFAPGPGGAEPEPGAAAPAAPTPAARGGAAAAKGARGGSAQSTKGPGERTAPSAPKAPAEPHAGEELDEFSLGDIGEQFGLSEAVHAPDEELNPALAVGGELAAAEAEVELSERDFRRLQARLRSLPLNLRLAIEELIGEQGLGGPQLEQLMDLLIGEGTPKEIAALVGKILGRRIPVPVSYERKTGLEFEAQKDTFAYRFRHNIFPILRTFVLGAAAIAIVLFLGYRYVYRPLDAVTLYGRGYTDLQNDRFIDANQLFDRAVKQWRLKNWYYRFAEGFVQKKQYAFAAEKYDALLNAYPGDRKGTFDYAAMESAILGNYPKAEQLLNRILSGSPFDQQGLLAAGDNYLAWGSIDPSKYEQARHDYAVLIEKYGAKDEYLFRMLRYFVKTDNLDEVLALERRFQGDPRIRVDPIAYAELGGYLIDKGRLDDVKAILMRALKVDGALPETHYNLARYFGRVSDHTEEAKALQNTLYFLQRTGALTTDRLSMLIDTYDRVGESLYREKRYLDAQQAYLKGIGIYEGALGQGQLTARPEFGKLYANLGDLNYYAVGNYNEALNLYLRAEANGYATSDVKYRTGYIYYRNQDYERALVRFYSAAGEFSQNPGLLFATANTLFQRNDLFAAQGYYDNVLNILEQQRAAIRDFSPQTRTDDRAILTNLMKVYNNLGVTLIQLSKRSPDPSKYSRGLADLTLSAEDYDQLTRNPSTMQPAQAINLAFINTKSALFPTPNYQLQIYADLPKDMATKQF